MLLSIFVVYLFVSSIFSIASNTQDVNTLQDTLLEAREFLDSASQNINNIDAYEMYLQELEVRLKELERRGVFAEDTRNLRRDMMILEAQVNGVQSYEPVGDLVYHSFSEEREVVKLVRTDSGKLYAVHERSITGPIVR